MDYWIHCGSSSGKYNGFLQDEKECLHSNTTGSVAVEDVDNGGTMSMPKILLIVFGVCLLLINICAYAALYNQRRKLQAQELLIKTFYSEVDITNSKVMYVEHGSGRHAPENLPALGVVRKKCNSKGVLQTNCEGQYVTARNREAGDITGDDYESSRREISRQCSASTMDTNTKVRRWIECELNQRSSPELRSLSPAPLKSADQKNIPTRQESNMIHLPVNDLSQVLVKPIVHRDPNASSSTTSKRNATVNAVPRKMAKKVSVAVDATPSARIASMLCKPLKATSLNASIQASQSTLCLKETIPTGPESCCVNSTLVPALDPQAEPSNCSNVEYLHLKKNYAPQANHLVTNTKKVSSHLRSVIQRNSCEVDSSDIKNKIVNKSSVEVGPKKIKSHGTKKDVGINTERDESVVETLENIKYITSKDNATDTDEKLPNINSLKNTYGGNEIGILSSEQNAVIEHEDQISCRKGFTFIRTVTHRRLSFPSRVSWPLANRRQSAMTKGISRDNKSTRLSRRRNPSTTGRQKSDTTAPLLTVKKLECFQDSSQTNILTAASPSSGSKLHTAGSPSTLTCVHQEPKNAHTSRVTVEEQCVEKDDRVRQELPSASLSSTTLRTAEAEKTSFPKAAYLKPRTRTKVSVGTSTNSLIPSEGKSTARSVKNPAEGKNQKGKRNGKSWTFEDKG